MESSQVVFEDHLAIMVDKLSGDEFVEEICKGFELLKDIEKGLITFDSLKKNARYMDLEELSDEELEEMINEGDYDGDGMLSEMEFCVLMFRLSPNLMDQAQDLLHHQLDQYLY